MTDSSARRTPSPRAGRRAPGPPSALDRSPNGESPTVNELLETRYRRHLATGFTPDLAVVLAQWDLAGYLRVTTSTPTGGHDRP